MSAIANVLLLRLLIAAGEQDDERDAASNEIHSITGPVIDAHLRDATADGPHVTWIADLQAVDARLDAPLRTAIAQTCEPVSKDRGLANLNHGLM